MIHCACLVIEADKKLLLVRVRDNERYYFPGGKIEVGESAQEALGREILEELKIELAPDTIQFLTTITGPALNSDEEVELVCFSGEMAGSPEAGAEISDISWISMSDHHLLAPAVKIFCDRWYR